MTGNRMDAKELLRDLVRKEEAEHLHNKIHDICNEIAESEDTFGNPHDKAVYLRGLDEALLVIDARIGHLRDRWAT
jgi:hypothetical protein